ncbi:amino acid ABC transporter permease [Streptomyces sp. PSKA54]|uniref:Amino acid ABC transporter permease n=1 Tax=Streptomyces himalayensis subsp. aureolus TaxID=2758039 RepID=A0A7W2D8Z4_9ACTN|nr:amino acid ABC transporter permease [Streptomyces himalayensis]MBA4866928.1 amino acid ABC transporter permease [Streptomyces himalayensis subsp. aureolus]
MDVIIDNAGLFWSGWLRTVEICLYAAIGSLAVGLAVAVARVSPVPVLQRLGALWVQCLRNCPLTVVLFFMAFGLPEVGLQGSYFWFGVTGLVCYTSAFICEAVRSGINAVPAGQAEAARAIGLTFGAGLRLVVLPQALRSMVPPLGNALIAMIKNSAIVGAFGVGGELFSVADTLTSARGLPALPTLTGVVAGYLLLILPVGFLLGALERKVAIAR